MSRPYSGRGEHTPAAYARDVRVTWWYTASSILFLHVFAALIWTLAVFVGGTPAALAVNLLGVAGSAASAVLLVRLPSRAARRRR